ncbi:MAG TPA: TonB family protein [Terracidiphilus sp.]|jgi:TonB family protein|nr:TonB family protein [Terracidiphilus sp.]
MGSASIPSIGQLWEGRTIDGKFGLLEWLGGSPDRGAFVTLRAGMHKSVIKITRVDDDKVDAYLTQWELARSLSHPHLMPIFEFGRCSVDGATVVYVVTEYAERVLAQFIEDRPLKPHEATNILFPIADALSYLHAKGFVHGHVKPSNILVSSDELKLSSDSFLVAAAVPTRVHQPQPYDAPEIASGVASAAADTWSLGMTLAEALTQQVPYFDPATNTPPAISPLMPQPFLGLVHTCLRIDPAARCSLNDIKAQLADVPPAPVPPRAPAEVQGRVQARVAPEPVYTYAPQPPVAPAPSAGKWRQEDPHMYPASSSSLFSDIEEANLTRTSKIPTILGLLLLAAISTFVLEEAGVLHLPLPFALPGIPAATQKTSPPPPAPQSTPPQNVAAAQQPATGESPAPATTPDPASPTSAAPSSTAPIAPTADGTSPRTTASTPASATPAPTAAAPASAVPLPPGSTPAAVAPAQTAPPSSAVPQIATPAPRPANAPGDIAKRVLPDVSPGARSSMRAPVAVILRVTVNRNGSVADASYVSPGSGNYFARAAQHAAVQWKFDPPLSGGRPQASVWRLHFFFSRSSSVEVTAEQEGP